MRRNRSHWHNEIILLFASGSTLKRTLFALVCLITLLGSSFRPQPSPEFAKGSIDMEGSGLETVSSEDESASEGLFYTVYQVQKGDTISGIAEYHNLTVDTIISINGIQSAKSLKPGQLLKLPNMSGIIYTAKPGETVAAIAKKFEISEDRLIVANSLMKTDFSAEKVLFLPDARLPKAQLREISGDLFKWPVRGVITSWYGWRKDPFSGRNSLHNGIDIGVPTGTPVGAAMEGTVIETGYSPIMGKYVILSHSGGWKTLYAHLSSILAQEGQYVSKGSRIALSGNTGYSTGPHLHFTVYKNGKPVNPANVLQ